MGGIGAAGIFDLETNGVYLLRLIFSAVCGWVIGWERSKHGHAAGSRTHAILAMSCCLLMIVSKYGFYDIQGQFMSVDASRIAAGALSVIGFLTAGVIFVQRGNVIGLTTAAGLVAVVCIGLAFGAGMYVLGFLSSVLVFILEMIHKHHNQDLCQITYHVTDMKCIDAVTEDLKNRGIEVLDLLKMSKMEDGTLHITLSAELPLKFGEAAMTSLIEDNADRLIRITRPQ